MAGQQNFIDLTLEAYKKNSKKFMLHSSDKYFLNKRFAIGGEIDRDRLRYSQIMHSILELEETELIDWVSKKIKGETVKAECYSKCDSCYYEDLSTCSVNGCFKWEKVEW